MKPNPIQFTTEYCYHTTSPTRCRCYNPHSGYCNRYKKMLISIHENVHRPDFCTDTDATFIRTPITPVDYNNKQYCFVVTDRCNCLVQVSNKEATCPIINQTLDISLMFGNGDRFERPEECKKLEVE